MLFKSKKEDQVFIVTNPAFLLLLTSYVASVKRLKLYVLVHDVFPENVVAAGIIKPNSFALKILKNLFDKAYSRSLQILQTFVLY